jgi:hypothetical protein
MFEVTCLAMNSSTSSGILTRRYSAFILRIAIRVSYSGDWMSVMRPHSKRERSRLSRVRMSRGGRSLERMICCALVEGVEV